MGRLCLGFMLIIAVCFLPGKLVASGIALPEAPRVVLPPNLQESQSIDADLEKKQKHRQKIAPETQPGESRAELQQKELAKEAIEQRPMSFFLELQGGMSSLLVRGPYANYRIDPITAAQFFWRHDQARPTNQIQLYYGLRMQALSGSAVYKNTPARFGFLFYGPMVGLGSYSLVAQSLGASGVKLSELVRSGYMVSLGLAAVSRWVRAERDMPEPDGSFTTKDTYESPGIWTEAKYTWIHFGAVGLSLSGGVQLAEKKSIFYFAGGLSAWH